MGMQKARWKTSRASLLALVAGCFSSLLFSGGAEAAAVTVGSPLTGPFLSTLSCKLSKGCTYANTDLAEPGARIAAPISGTIVRWRLAGNFGGKFKLRVLH